LRHSKRGGNIDMTKKQNLTEFIQIRVTAQEKAYIQLLAKKQPTKGVSALIMGLLYDELGRRSLFDKELNEVRIKLMEVQ
jgi:hypothetical protein